MYIGLATVKMANGRKYLFRAPKFCSYLKEGDKVIVETRDGFNSEGEVLKVDKNVSEKCSPVPIKRALKIIKKL